VTPFDPKSINQLRSGLGMSQRQFAEHVGVPHSTIYRWESGISQPNAVHLGQMHDLAAGQGMTADFFGVAGVKRKDPYSR
jgi:DNA-binding transcriptional regulator YiaG